MTRPNHALHHPAIAIVVVRKHLQFMRPASRVAELGSLDVRVPSRYERMNNQQLSRS